MDDFTVNLHRRLPPEGNLVWSPYSVASALALVAAGARGRTLEELTRVLGAPPERLRLAEAAAPGDAEIRVANTLWAHAGLTFEDAYRRSIADLPGASVRVADFAADPEAARQAVNREVEKVTNELIRDLLPPGAVDRRTAAVLANALYLKAAWESTFAERDTRPETFHGARGPHEVPMMRRTGRMPYAEADGWRMAAPAADGGVSVEVLLGTDPAAAPPDPGLLRTLRASARSVRVALSLPRFRVESRVSLGECLGALGAGTAFTGDADLSGMAAEPVHLDRIEHKAVLDVDEAGVEGAAATAVVVTLSAYSGRPVEFRVDRPFLVFVRHAESEAVYFAARVTDL
ncbi:serpin family protein [Actinoallomurus purpureus]|uniref:serpin family protein n=1 Tax=Actinoallomurus purpureus TaxID=478114 RepID=UPI0020932D45|nr:serpin family protein [Actinoallomurus purpureus]MCO6007673.1 serpin family protein [Actinoallomurus purpureus]